MTFCVPFYGKLLYDFSKADGSVGSDVKVKSLSSYFAVSLENAATRNLKLMLGTNTAISSSKAVLLIYSQVKPDFRVGGKYFLNLLLLRFTRHR